MSAHIKLVKPFSFVTPSALRRGWPRLRQDGGSARSLHRPLPRLRAGIVVRW